MTRLKTSTWFLVLAAATAGCSGTEALDLSTSGAARIASSTTPTRSPETTASPAAGDIISTTLTDQSSVGALPGQSMAAISPASRIQFAPVIGAAAETVQPLSNRLALRAGQRGLAISPTGQSAPFIVKGYFSTVSDEKGTTIIFVWDVLDPAGNRLHRIQGQEKATGSGEGWGAVTSANMDAVADRTIEELATWLQAGHART
ncbi:hypothetical protein [Chelativorans sp. J32]|uniref:hypothetical protein n=1 Tax=Chelativorans sp. J32 TaxID=935840 RepID=UPI000484B8C4|nr:hypothetical protein [Chelativorans sp. J32]